jgi:hypothetical protein
LKEQATANAGILHFVQDDDLKFGCVEAGLVLGVGDAEEFGHFGVEEALAGTVGLDPFAVEDELGDCALADVGDDLVGCAGSVLDVDLFEGYFVLVEEALGFAAVAAPGG